MGRRQQQEREKAAATAAAATETTTATAKTDAGKKPKGAKLDAIVLKPAEGKAYADILYTIRTAVKP